MILSQNCETMTGMSRRLQLLPWICAVAFLALAGCCGGGSTHQCDFTPPTSGQDAGNSDGGIPCPDMPCKSPQVCCLTKAPVNAFCVDIQDFIPDNCTKFNNDPPSCYGPKDCTSGTVCCYQDAISLVSCQATDVCMGAGTTIVCNSDQDCPGMMSGSCPALTIDPDTGLPLGLCQ